MKTLRNELKNVSFVEDINGIGMEIGVRLRKNENEKTKMKSMILQVRKKGLHLAYADDFSFQIMPPLTIKRSVLDKGIEIFIKTIKSLIL